MNKYKGNSKLLTDDQLEFLLNKYRIEIENDDIKVTYSSFKNKVRYLSKTKRDLLNFSQEVWWDRTGFIIDVKTKELFIEGIKKYNYDWNLILLQQTILKLLLNEINVDDLTIEELNEKYKQSYFEFFKEKGWTK